MNFKIKIFILHKKVRFSFYIHSSDNSFILFYFEFFALWWEVFYFVRNISYSSFQKIFIAYSLWSHLWNSCHSSFGSIHNFIVVCIIILTNFFSTVLSFPVTKIVIRFERFFKNICLSEPIYVILLNYSFKKSVIDLKLSTILLVKSKSESVSKSWEYFSKAVSIIVISRFKFVFYFLFFPIKSKDLGLCQYFTNWRSVFFAENMLQW